MAWVKVRDALNASAHRGQAVLTQFEWPVNEHLNLLEGRFQIFNVLSSEAVNSSLPEEENDTLRDG